MRIEREIEIGRPLDEVFAFVSDPCNDPRWCRKVRSVEQVGGDGPGPDTRYAVAHKPVPGKPEREMEMICVGFDPPRRLQWREDDGTDVFLVTYQLEAAGADRTRMVQRSDVELGAPRILHGVYRIGIGRDIAGQLRELTKLLEQPA